MVRVLRQVQDERVLSFRAFPKGPLMLSLSKHARWAGVLALVSCSPKVADETPGDPIECALDGAAQFTASCRVERQIVPGASILVIRHPDGGFRRFEIEGDIVRTADGLDAAAVTVLRDATEVAVGTDRYRFPPPAPPVDAKRR